MGDEPKNKRNAVRSESGPEAPTEFLERVKRLSVRDRLPATLGIECVDAGPGRAVVRVQVGENHLNSHGMCHGGLIFTVADTAFGLASNSHGVVAVGVEAHISYHVAAKRGDVLIGTASEVSRNRKLASYRIDVTTQEGVLIASFTGTAYVTSRSTDAVEAGV
jgi:phenylacetic acid degradation protein PaaD